MPRLEQPSFEPREEHQPFYVGVLANYHKLMDEYIANPTTDLVGQVWNSQQDLEALLRQGGKFPLGRLLMTPGAQEAMHEQLHVPAEFLVRHVHGDWGKLEPEDVEENELSLREGFRLLSSYSMRYDGKLWVITERDRSATTLLLPDEY
jgi:hypothetical protein